MLTSITRFILLYLTVTLIGAFSAQAQTSVQITSDNFTLSGEIDGAAGIDIISELERFRSALLEVHDLPANQPERRLDIYVVTDPEIFEILGVSKDFVAVYAPTPAGPRALINGSLPEMSTSPGSALRRSLRHEYAHHFTYTHLPIAQPRWLSEGLAEFYAGYTELPDGSYQIGTPDENAKLILSYPIDGWADMRGVLRSHQKIGSRLPRRVSLPPKGWARTPDNISFFYAQTWGFVHWAMNRTGETNLLSAHETLGELAEKLIGMESYLTRGDDILAPPSLKSWQESKLALDEITAGIALESFGFPLQGSEKGAETSGSLEEAIAAHVAGPASVITRQPRAGRITSSVEITNLSATESAAVQYRNMSLTAGSSALINPRMQSLKAEIETNPDLATSLLVSQAALQYTVGGTQTAINLITEAKAKGGQDKDIESLSLEIAFGDFLNRNFMNPELMRGKIQNTLSKYPNDPQLLGMMATTGMGDARNGETFAPEVQAALDKMVALEIPKREPTKALPLVNLYLQMEDYQSALDLLYRAEPFIDKGNSYTLRSSIDEIQRVVKEQQSGTP